MNPPPNFLPLLRGSIPQKVGQVTGIWPVQLIAPSQNSDIHQAPWLMWFNWQKTTVCVHGKDVPLTHKNPVLEWFPNWTLSLINLLLSAFPSFTQSVKANYKRSGVCWGWDKMGKLPWWMQIEISQMHWISASQWASENPDLTACLVLKGLYYELNQSGQTSTMWRLMVCEFVPEDSKKKYVIGTFICSLRFASIIHGFIAPSPEIRGSMI